MDGDFRKGILRRTRSPGGFRAGTGEGFCDPHPQLPAATATPRKQRSGRVSAPPGAAKKALTAPMGANSLLPLH